jgi:hypothetical protein
MFAQRRRRRTVAVLGSTLVMTAALMVLTVGCTPPAVTSPPLTPSGDPIFESDESAFEASSAVYRDYLAMVDLILSEGGSGPERIDQVSAPPFSDQIKADFLDYKSKSLRTSGVTTTKSLTFQSQSESQGGVTVTLYACDDVSGVDVIDANDQSIVSPHRDPTTPYEVTIGGLDENGLRVTGKSFWTGADFCDE